MKKLIGAAALACAVVALGGAEPGEPAYEKIATVHDIMEDIQKPAMDRLAALKKAGGPQSDKDWKRAHRAASILGESSQLLLMGGRVKDEVWSNGAAQVVAAAKSTMAAAQHKNMDAWNQGMMGIGKGCRGCHKVHKPKKGRKGKKKS